MVHKKYKLFVKNKKVINDQNNLTRYNDEKSFYFQDITTYPVFKKCDFQFNKFYWEVKNKHMCYFYHTSDNLQDTLTNILQTTKLSEIRTRSIDDFFEYLLISYIARENEQLLKELNKYKQMTIEDGITLRIQDFFSLETQSSATDDRHESDDKTSTPDVLIIHERISY